MKKILLSLSLAIFSLFVVSQVDVRSSIKGYVNDGSGPVEGAEVVVVYMPTGSSDTAVTGAGGDFVFNNLAPGGPYTVTVSKAGYAKLTQLVFSQSLVKHQVLMFFLLQSLKRLLLVLKH